MQTMSDRQDTGSILYQETATNLHTLCKEAKALVAAALERPQRPGELWMRRPEAEVSTVDAVADHLRGMELFDCKLVPCDVTAIVETRTTRSAITRNAAKWGWRFKTALSEGGIEVTRIH